MNTETPFAGICEATAGIFREAGYIRPMLMVPTADGVLVMDTSTIMDHKDALAIIIREVRRVHPLAYFITEAWICMAKDEDDALKGPPPSERPDRIEVVMVTAYEGVNIEVAYAPINRPESKPPFLSPWETFDKGGKMEGRLALPLQNEN